MNSQIMDIVTIAGVVQTAVAPVFLLSAVGAMLAVLSARLGRISDRARELELDLETTLADAPHKAVCTLELKQLWRRAELINWSFSSCTVCALLICIVVVMLFMSHIASMSLGSPISITFIVAMLFMILGLLLLLREVFMATGNMRHTMGPPNIAVVED